MRYFPYPPIDFPNRYARVLGTMDAVPMGYTDYQWGGIIGLNPNNDNGSGFLYNYVTYGTTISKGLSSSGANFRTYNTGTVADTLAGERSTDTITRQSVNPILFTRTHMDVANTDTRWFMGFSDLTDIPANTDEPLANQSGVGLVIDDGTTNNSLEFHINNGAATATSNTVIAEDGTLATVLDNRWTYYVIDLDQNKDTATVYIWTQGIDGTPRDDKVSFNGTGLLRAPTYTSTHTSASSKLSTGTNMRYHNVINNDSTTNKTLNIAEVHIVNRSSFDNVNVRW